MTDLGVIETLESQVRSYCRQWPAVFTRARGSTMWDTEGREYIDFFAGAGALNYGHNHPRLKRALLDYLESDGVVHSLDMATVAKQRLLERFRDVILEPRRLDYRVQFPGPTGTNAVEAALKLARKVTGRETVIGFTNAFHGMTLGSLALTGNEMKRGGGGVPLSHAISMPYDGFLGDDTDSLAVLRSFLAAEGSGVDRPAAFIVETVQGEGGVNVAGQAFLRGLAEIAREAEALLIVDDVQMGCGRTGPFFSFEPAGITPDIVCLSKSISGYGLPMALTLFKSEYDVWGPGEHNGTFRGHNPAFVTATEALDAFWGDDGLTQDVRRKGGRVRAALTAIAARWEEARASVRGRGLIQGLHFDVAGLAEEVSEQAFSRALICETSGATSDVLKVMPPLVIDDDLLDRGLAILEDAVAGALAARGLRAPVLAGATAGGGS